MSGTPTDAASSSTPFLSTLSEQDHSLFLPSAFTLIPSNYPLARCSETTGQQVYTAYADGDFTVLNFLKLACAEELESMDAKSFNYLAQKNFIIFASSELARFKILPQIALKTHSLLLYFGPEFYPEELIKLNPEIPLEHYAIHYGPEPTTNTIVPLTELPSTEAFRTLFQETAVFCQSVPIAKRIPCIDHLMASISEVHAVSVRKNPTQKKAEATNNGFSCVIA